MKQQPYSFIFALMGLAIAALLSIAVVPRIVHWSQPKPLTLALSDWPGDQVLTFVDQLQFDAQYNLALDLRRVPAEDDRLALWRSNVINTQFITIDAGFTVAASDDIRIIYAYDASFGADAMLAINTIRSPAELRGKIIGVEFGYPSHFLTLNILANAGLSADDVTLVDVQFDEVEAAFASGQVAAVATWGPNSSDLLAQRSDLHVLRSSRDFPALIFDVIMVRTSELEANRAAYVNLIRAMDAAIQQCNANLHPCLELLAAESGRAVAQWEADFSGVRLLDLATNQQLFNDTSSDGLPAKLQAIYSFLLANRRGLPVVDISQWLDGSLVNEAAAQR